MLAKAAAKEANVPFISASGTKIVLRFYGSGSTIRDVFDMARKNAPCILFIDEVDAIGSKQASSHIGIYPEDNKPLNQVRLRFFYGHLSPSLFLSY